MQNLYKIRRPSDGLFFSGAGYKKKTWTTNGRSYSSQSMANSAIRTSLRQTGQEGNWDSGPNPQDIEIVEYEIREVQTLAFVA